MAIAFETLRERRLWITAGALLLSIYATLYLVRPVADWLRQRGLLRIAIAVAFLAAAAALLRWCLAGRAGRREIAVLTLFGVLYLAVLWPIAIPEERFHVVEYGVLGGIVYAALLERRRPGGGLHWSARSAFAAALLVGLAGWLDEGIQHLLPNRDYGWYDFGLNLLGAVLAIAALAALGEARAADRAARGPA